MEKKKMNLIQYYQRMVEKLMREKYNGEDNIDFIYSSPFSRCVETSIVFIKYILKKYKKDIKIRIDYGLCPQIPGDWIFDFLINQPIISVLKIINLLSSCSVSEIKMQLLTILIFLIIFKELIILYILLILCFFI